MSDDELVSLLGPIEEPIGEKLLHVVKLVVSNLPETPIDAFVSTVSGGSGLNYDGVWLFTPNFVSEIRNPLSSNRVQHDVARFSGLVDWVRLTAHNYEFLEPHHESRLELEFSTSDGLSGILSGVGFRCEGLMKIYHERFLKNITAPGK